MSNAKQSTVSCLLADIRTGVTGAKSQLIELVYDELRKQAGGLMRNEPIDHTIQPTMLAHDALERLGLFDSKAIDFEGRAHFFASASRAMRQILVDHARTKRALKRGGDRLKCELDKILSAYEAQGVHLLDLNDALNDLEKLNPRQKEVIECRFFGGLTGKQIGAALNIAEPTVERDLRMAKAWLHNRLGQDYIREGG